MTRKQFNAFWVYANLEVWPTTQINKEQCHVCMGKSARRSIPNHQEHDLFDNSAQMLWVASETTIQYNASESGLAVTLLQNGQSVAFVSRSLSAVERRYARNNRKRLLGDSFRMQPFQSVSAWRRINDNGDRPQATGANIPDHFNLHQNNSDRCSFDYRSTTFM